MNMNKPINTGVVGATGLVGETFLRLLESRGFPLGDLKLFASERSLGETRKVRGRDYPIELLSDGCFEGLDLVFFSSGDDISKEWAPKAAKAGAYAVDNSAAFRMDPDTSLVVPEVNADRIPAKPSVIANPNCSTIQLAVALNGLKKFGLKSVKVASYQAASGGGNVAQAELREQLQAALAVTGTSDPMSIPLTAKAFPHPLAFNCLPQIGGIDDSGFCSEENKINKETKKILELPGLPVSAFTVRVPAWNVHSEAVWVELNQDASRDEILASWQSQPGVIVDSSLKTYPHARDVHQKGEVYIGRLRQDPEDPKTWLFWVVADNLLKGAALNGLQIAEQIFDIHR